MSTQAWPAQGTTIGIDETGTGTFTLINEVLSIGHAGGGEVGERDTTVLVSTVRTNAPTIPDNGECTFSLNLDPTDAVHKFVRNLKDAPAIKNWQVVFSTGATVSSATFPGWVKDFDGPNAEDVDSNLTADVTVRVAGAVTWVAAT